MGIVHNLFIGPYAEFLVPAGQAEQFPPEDEDGNLLCWESLMCDLGMSRRTDCYRYMPDGTGTKQPARTMYAGDKHGACFPSQDLSDVDRQGEMAWFAQQYANELRVLKERYAASPTIRWGIVCWYS
jgi:hypothetical protein